MPLGGYRGYTPPKQFRSFRRRLAFPEEQKIHSNMNDSGLLYPQNYPDNNTIFVKMSLKATELKR